MRKLLFLLMLLFSVLLFSACNNDPDELSGKTFNVSVPLPSSDADVLNYHTLMTLDFSDDHTVTNTNGGAAEEGTYKIDDDVLIVNFENDNETLDIEFIDFKESDKDDIAYSTTISAVALNIENDEQVSHLRNLLNQITGYTRVEFIEE